MVVDYGSNIVTSFAGGMMDAVGAVADALASIGNMITYWLEPGSPPNLLPFLDVWGKGAMDAYLEGWTEADFSMLDDLSGKIESALSAIDPSVDDADIAKIRDGVAQAIGNFKITGSVDTSFLGDLVTRAGELEPYREEIERLGKAYFEAALSSQRLVQTEKDLAGIEKELQALERGDDAANLQRIVENRFASEEQRRMASLKLAKMQKEADLETAKAADEQAQSALALAEVRYDTQFDFLELSKQQPGAAGGGTAEGDKAARAKKPKAPKKAKGLSETLALANSLKDKFKELGTEMNKGLDTSKLKEFAENNPIKKAFDDGALAVTRLKLAWEMGVKGMSTPTLLTPLEQQVQRIGNAWKFVLDNFNLAQEAFGRGLQLQEITAGADAFTQSIQAMGIVAGAAYLGWIAFTSGVNGTPLNPDATPFEQFMTKIGTGVSQLAEMDFAGALATFRAALVEGINGLFGSGQTVALDWPAIGVGALAALNAGLTIGSEWLRPLREAIVTSINGLFGSGQTTAIDWPAIGTGALAALNAGLTVAGEYLQPLREEIVTSINALFGSEQAATLDWPAIAKAAQGAINTALTLTGDMLETAKTGIVTGINGLFGSEQTVAIDWPAIGTAVQGALDKVKPTFETLKTWITEGLNSLFSTEGSGEGGIVATVQGKLNLLFADIAFDATAIATSIQTALADHPWTVAGIAAAIATALTGTSWITGAASIASGLAGATWGVAGIVTSIVAALGAAAWAVGPMITTMVTALGAGTWTMAGVVTTIGSALAAVSWAGPAALIAAGVGLALLAVSGVEAFSSVGSKVVTSLSEAIKTGDYTTLKSDLKGIIDGLFASFKTEDGGVTASSIGEGIGGGLNNASQKLTGFVNGLLEQISETLNTINFAEVGFVIGQFTVNMIKEIADTIVEINWAEAFSTVFEAGSAFLAGLTGGIVSGITTLDWGETFLGVFDSLKGAIVGAIEGMINGVIDTVNAGLPDFAKMGRMDMTSDPVTVEATVDILAWEQGELGAKLLGGASSVPVPVAPVVDEAQQKLVSESVLAWASTVGVGAGEAQAHGMNQGLADGLTTGPMTLEQAQQKWLDALNTFWGINSPSETAKTGIGMPIGEGIILGLSESLTGAPVLEITTGLVDSLLAQFTRLRTDAVTTLTTMSTEAQGVIEEMAQLLLDMTEQMVEDLLKLFEDLRTQVVAELRRTVTEGTAAFARLETVLKGVAQRAIDGVINALREGAERISATLNGLAGAVVTDEVKQKWIDGGFAIGKAFAEGVAKGILDNVDKVEHAAETLVDKGNDAGKARAESHSPSELTRRELGKPFGEGFALGVLDTVASAEAVIADAIVKVLQATRAVTSEGLNGLAASANGTINIAGAERAKQDQIDTVAQGFSEVLPDLVVALRDGLAGALTTAEFFNGDGVAAPIESAAGGIERAASHLSSITDGLGDAMDKATAGLQSALESIKATMRIDSRDKEKEIGGGITPTRTSFANLTPAVAAAVSNVATASSIPVAPVIAANTVNNVLNVEVKDAKAAGTIVKNWAIGGINRRAF